MREKSAILCICLVTKLRLQLRLRKYELISILEGGQEGQNLPLPVTCSPTFRTFTSFCLPSPDLYSVTPVFKLIKGFEPKFRLKVNAKTYHLSTFSGFVLFEGG